MVSRLTLSLSSMMMSPRPSPEEADAIRDLIADILGSGTTWVDRKGSESPISLDDVLVIAPYNVQVFELQERLQ
jgi:uncharacterized protein